MITDAQLDALLETLVRYRSGRQLADAWIACFVLLAIEGVKPATALGWSVADIVQQAGPGQWQIRKSIKVRNVPTVITVRTRAALTIYLARMIADGQITRLDSSPFFRVTKRAIQFAWVKTRERAKIGAVTFHDLRKLAEPKKAAKKRAPLQLVETAEQGAEAPAKRQTARKRSR